FVGQKRFSIEGGEALIPALNAIVKKASDTGIGEILVGMAHRGRLNVLANIFEKNYSDIFGEFEGKEYDDEGIFDGDVKYHLGYSTTVKNDKDKTVRLTLSPNPSHLEAVDPVVEGMAKAIIDNQRNENKKEVLPIL